MSPAALQDSTVAARVPLDLRADLDRLVERLRTAGVHYPDGREVDRSFVIRQALRAWCVSSLTPAGELDVAGNATLHNLDDADLARLELGRGAARASDPSTAREAAAAMGPPRAGSARYRALEVFEAAHEVGRTADEIVVALAPAPHNGTARRVTDLLQGGFIEERLEVELDRRHAVLGAGGHRLNGRAVERRTRAGAWARVYRITTKGKAALARHRQDVRDPGGRR